MKVYVLKHERQIEPGVTSTMLIGLYSSKIIVDKTISKYKNIVGFKDFPNDFVVKEFEIKSHGDRVIPLGQPVYFMQHEYSVDEDGIIYDYCTDIDVFANYNDAKKEMEELILEEAYPKSPNGLYAPYGFNIDECIIDEDNWMEGFVTY